jgi:hypothetical protein
MGEPKSIEYFAKKEGTGWVVAEETVVISWDPAANEGGRNRILEIDNDDSLGR